MTFWTWVYRPAQAQQIVGHSSVTSVLSDNGSVPASNAVAESFAMKSYYCNSDVLLK